MYVICVFRLKTTYNPGDALLGNGRLVSLGERGVAPVSKDFRGKSGEMGGLSDCGAGFGCRPLVSYKLIQLIIIPNSHRLKSVTPTPYISLINPQPPKQNPPQSYTYKRVWLNLVRLL